MKRSLTLEWLLMSLCLLALVFWLSGPLQFPRANLWFKDLALRLHSPEPSPDVVLIAVDERSLASIGRWPWRRALHAHLIDFVSMGQPRSIGLDILLAEADLDYPEDDALLAHSMVRSGRRWSAAATPRPPACRCHCLPRPLHGWATFTCRWTRTVACAASMPEKALPSTSGCTWACPCSA